VGAADCKCSRDQRLNGFIKCNNHVFRSDIDIGSCNNKQIKLTFTLHVSNITFRRRPLDPLLLAHTYRIYFNYNGHRKLHSMRYTFLDFISLHNNLRCVVFLANEPYV
jgi:hypothetical protein